MSARHSNKNNCHSNNNIEKQPDRKEIDNKNKKINSVSPASPFSTSKSLSWISIILLHLVLDPHRHNSALRKIAKETLARIQEIVVA